MNFFLLTASTLCFLASCTTQKDPLKGTREDFLASSIFKPDPLFSKKNIHLPVALKNSNWPVADKNLNLKAQEISKRRWQKCIGKGVSSGLSLMPNMVANNSHIFTMDTAGNISAINQVDGQEEWSMLPTKQDDNALAGGLAIENDILVATSSSGDIIALNANDGAQLWQVNVEAPIRIAAAIHAGTAYIVTISNELIAVDIHTGKILWKHQGINELSAILGGAEPVINGSTVVVAYSSGEYYALNAKTGDVLWSDTLTAALRSDTISSITHIVANPIIDNDTVYVISHGGKMVATDIKTGNRNWQQNIGSIHNPIMIDDFLFIVSDFDELICMDKKTGKIKYAVNLQDYKTTDKDKKSSFSSPLLIDGKILITTSQGELLYIAVQDGKLLTTFKTDQNVMHGPAVVNTHYFVLSNDGTLTAYE
jgi:outer membrane protein assembly factor BamB